MAYSKMVRSWQARNIFIFILPFLFAAICYGQSLYSMYGHGPYMKRSWYDPYATNRLNFQNSYDPVHYRYQRNYNNLQPMPIPYTFANMYRSRMLPNALSVQLARYNNLDFENPVQYRSAIGGLVGTLLTLGNIMKTICTFGKLFLPFLSTLGRVLQGASLPGELFLTIVSTLGSVLKGGPLSEAGGGGLVGNIAGNLLPPGIISGASGLLGHVAGNLLPSGDVAGNLLPSGITNAVSSPLGNIFGSLLPSGDKNGSSSFLGNTFGKLVPSGIKKGSSKFLGNTFGKLFPSGLFRSQSYELPIPYQQQNLHFTQNRPFPGLGNMAQGAPASGNMAQGAPASGNLAGAFPPSDKRKRAASPLVNANDNRPLNGYVQNLDQLIHKSLNSSGLYRRNLDQVFITPDICLLERTAGSCSASFERYYYNSVSKQCEKFLYGGCEGNANNFLMKDECESVCLGNKRNPLKDATFDVEKLVYQMPPHA